MKRANTSSLVFLFVLWLFIFSTVSIEARKYHGKKSKMHKNKKHNDGDQYNPPDGVNSPTPTPAPLPHFSAYPTQSPVFSILLFGAKANGVFDDSKALLAAWKSACKVTGGVVEIPSELKFLIKPVTLRGPCMPNLVLQVSKHFSQTRTT
ncbi:hypothetical protein Pfo_031310 [Paulownia fortunei]|nr:hypothetical protein Pfo_031310 [Paulownia fortunei]